MKERRDTPPPAPMAGGLVEGPAGAPPNMNALRDQRTGFYTMAALHEFIRYEIDGGAQTERNERFVSPLCLVAVSIDALPALPDDLARGRLIELTGDSIKRITRRSDRLARQGNDFVALLRRTLAKRAREYYAPHVTGQVVEITREAGCFTTLTFGIASLTEHLVRDPDDMIQKAFTALEHARKAGPGSVRMYDLRDMS